MIDNEELLAALEAEEEAAKNYQHGELFRQREMAVQEYNREPYGNEEEGLSTYISSDVMDAVEGMIPDILDVFAASDKAVQFDPTQPEDVEGAEQATDACNYIFYKKNDGFLILYTAIKDALLLKTGAIKWGWTEESTPIFNTWANLTEDQITQFTLTNPDDEIIEQIEEDPQPVVDPITGMVSMDEVGEPVLMPLYTIKTKRIEKKGRVYVTNIPPEELIVSESHSSPLLQGCPYVAHEYRATLSDMVEMGLDVTLEDIKAANDEYGEIDIHDNRYESSYRWDSAGRDDEAMQEGLLKEEYILYDLDGDGVAEQLKVYRLGKKICSAEPVSHVQIAGWSPYIKTHKFHGLSVYDLVKDIQRLKTEIYRQMLDGLKLTNNPTKTVLTDSNGAPQANIDDLLSTQPGQIYREFKPNAIRENVTTWTGPQAIPMLELLDQSKENRTGYTRYSQGLDSDALNQTARGVSLIMNASQKRLKLIARVMAECLLVPMFKGILKTSIDYNMEEISYQLNGKFVNINPQEWRDGYDMTINVGLGTGDKEQNMLAFQQIAMLQEKLKAAGKHNIVTDQNIYHLLTKITENAGFKDVQSFFTEPKDGALPPEIQMQMQQMQKAMQELQKENESLKADKSNDVRKTNIDAYKAETDRMDTLQQLVVAPVEGNQLGY